MVFSIRSKIHNLEFKKVIEIGFWALGKSGKLAVIQGSFLQVLVSALDILFLALVLPFVLSFSSTNESKNNIATFAGIRLSASTFLFLMLCVITIKSVLSLAIQRKILNKLAIREAEIGSAFIHASLFEKIDRTKSSHSIDLSQLVNSMLNTIFTNVLRPLVGFIGELATLFSVLIALTFFHPTIAMFTFIYFTMIAIFALKILGRKQRSIGVQILDFDRKSLRKFAEIKNAGLQLRLSNLEKGAVGEFFEQRLNFALSKSSSYILFTAPRFILEFFLILGLCLLFLLDEILGGAAISIATLALLTAAGYRILPSISAILVFSSNLKNSTAVFTKFEELGNRFGLRGSELVFDRSLAKTSYCSFEGDLVFENVFFKYVESQTHLLENFSRRLNKKTTTLIEGENGSGKTTLIHLALGLLEPNHGEIYMEKNGLRTSITARVSGISFVGQEVNLLDESIGFNIALRPVLDSDVQKLIEICKKVGLLSRIEGNEEGLNMNIGENGAKLSGGERQKVGIARSLFNSPSLLILDEPTANLDPSAENEVWQALQNLKGDLTIIVVSHRKVPFGLYDQRIQSPFIGSSTQN